MTAQHSPHTAHADVEQQASPVNYLNCAKSVASWLLTLDHKRIGLLYLTMVLISFMAGGFFALAIRTELCTPGGGNVLPNGNAYNVFFTLHGAIMVFMVIIPGVP